MVERMIEMKKINTLDGINKFILKEHGKDSTHLHLTETAKKILAVTDPLDIYELAIEQETDIDDFESDFEVVGYEYFCRGCIEADYLAEKELNNMIEQLEEEN
jgi:hypothetical protein